PARPHRHRRGDHARRPRRQRRPERRRNQSLHAAAGSRLHALPQTGWPERRPHRHPPAVLYDRFTPPGAKEPRGGLNADQAKAMAEAIAILKQQGAIIVDPADIPSVVSKDAKTSFLDWGTCSGADKGKGKDEDCSIVFKYGMKRDFNKWLASLGPTAPAKSLTE